MKTSVCSLYKRVFFAFILFGAFFSNQALADFQVLYRPVGTQANKPFPGHPGVSRLANYLKTWERLFGSISLELNSYPKIRFPSETVVYTSARTIDDLPLSGGDMKQQLETVRGKILFDHGKVSVPFEFFWIELVDFPGRSIYPNWVNGSDPGFLQRIQLRSPNSTQRIQVANPGYCEGDCASAFLDVPVGTFPTSGDSFKK